MSMLTFFNSGTQRHHLRVFNTEGTLLSSVQPHATMLAQAQRSHSTNALAGASNGPHARHGAYTSGYGAPRSSDPAYRSPISATAFHPHRMMLAAAALGDCRVVLVECRGVSGVGKGVVA